MAIDLTLCVVPSQIATIFSKAAQDADYAEWVSLVPTILKDQAFYDHGLREALELKTDAIHLKSYFQFTEDCYFYDTNRCSSTLDYLLDQYRQQHPAAIAPRVLWEGGTRIASQMTGGQGSPLRLYDRAAITAIHQLLAAIDPEQLFTFYDYQTIVEAGIYKATRPENKEALLHAFYAIEALFALAYEDDNLVILKRLD